MPAVAHLSAAAAPAAVSAVVDPALNAGAAFVALVNARPPATDLAAAAGPAAVSAAVDATLDARAAVVALGNACPAATDLAGATGAAAVSAAVDPAFAARAAVVAGRLALTRAIARLRRNAVPAMGPALAVAAFEPIAAVVAAGARVA